MPEISKDQTELDALLEEHAEDFGANAESEAAAPQESAPDPMPLPDPGIATAALPLVMGLGVIVCARFGVSPLNNDEVATLANALASVASAFGVGITDPRIAALCGLAAAGAAVALPRMGEFQANMSRTIPATVIQEDPASGEPESA
jgi:hypothetical protein